MRHSSRHVGMIAGHAHRTATSRLHAIHRRVRGADQLIAARMTAIDESGAETCIHQDRFVSEVMRYRHADADLLRDCEHVIVAANLRQEDHELVTAITGCRVTGTNAACKALGYDSKNQITGLVTESVVQVLEAVQIQQQLPKKGARLEL